MQVRHPTWVRGRHTDGMSWLALLLVAAALAVMGRGLQLTIDGRRQGRRPAADADERMVASLRVVAGVKLINRGAVLLVLALVLLAVVP
jgi:hypothetical protein